MKKIIADNRVFLSACVLFWLLLSILLLTNTKADLHLMLNSFHNPLMDVFFRFYTEVGGWVPFVVAAVLLFYKYSAAILVLVTQLLVSIPVQVIKEIVKEDRPRLYFEKLQIVLPSVKGVEMLYVDSFPSGHTASAFALFLALSIIAKKNFALQLLFFIMAVGVGFSRIYLCQHFAADVMAGSFIGVVVTIVYAYYHQRINASWMDKKFFNF